MHQLRRNKNRLQSYAVGGVADLIKMCGTTWRSYV